MKQLSLFEEIKKGGYQTAIFTTFSIDFSFYEDVLLRLMRSSGIEHHIVLVDKNMAVQSMKASPPVMAGKHYSLVPMHCMAAFHPKVILLLGPDKGLLVVGSHNLTLSGMGRNLEVTNFVRFHKSKLRENLSLFQQAYQAMKMWMEDYSADLPTCVVDSFKKVPLVCKWLNEQPTNEEMGYHLIYSGKQTLSLWSQLQPMLPQTSQIFGMSAFFDKSLALLSELKAYSNEPLTISVQEDTVSAPNSLLNYEGVKLVRTDSILIANKHRYDHAKMLYFDAQESSCFVSGSANLSAPAWLASGKTSNAECVLVIVGGEARDTFTSMGLADFSSAERVLELEFVELEETTSASNSIRLITASVSDDKSVSFEWRENGSTLVLGYGDVLEDQKSLIYEIHDSYVLISKDQIKLGQPLSIFIDGLIAGLVIFHDDRSIRNATASTQERRLRIALGTLNTDAPDITSLFDYLGRIISDSCLKNSNNFSLNSKRDKRNENEGVRETLISDLNDTISNAETGRLASLYSGDLGLILDILIRGMKDQFATSTGGINEDDLGRNEEELPGTEDEGEAPSVQVQSKVKEPKQDNLECLTQSKLNTSLNRLNAHLEMNGQLGIPAVLALTSFIYHLMQAKPDWSLGEQIRLLFELICKYLFKDNQPLFISELDEADFYASDEWTRMTAYSIWLAQRVGVEMRDRLPVSATREEKDELRWLNVCWLYFSQRFAHDEQLAKFTGELFTQSRNPSALTWFTALEMAARQLKNNNYHLSNGFALASVQTSAFPGYRLIVDETGDYFELASICRPGAVSLFRKSSLNVFVQSKV